MTHPTTTLDDELAVHYLGQIMSEIRAAGYTCYAGVDPVTADFTVSVPAWDSVHPIAQAPDFPALIHQLHHLAS